MEANHYRPLRRMGFGALVGGVTWVLLGGVLGVVNAAGEDVSADVPATFRVAEPRIGDKGTLVARTFNETTGAQGTYVFTTSVDFQFLGAGATRGPDGRSASADRFRVLVNHVGEVREELLLTYRPLDGAFLSSDYSRYVTTTKTIPRPVGPPDSYRAQRVEEQTSFVPDMFRGPFCGLRHGLQSGPLATAVPAPILGPCHLVDLGTFQPDDAPVRVRGLGPDVVDGATAMVFGGDDARGRTWTVWFNASVPYPLRVRIEDPSERRVTVQQLVNFEAGDGARPPTLEGKSIEAPSIALEPRTRVGPAEAPIPHPFPLSDALRRAESDTKFHGVRSFLQAHPAAYVSHARYDETRWNNAEMNLWSITLTDGVESVAFDLSRSRSPTAGGWVPPSAVPSPHDTVTFEFREGVDWLPLRKPLPEQLSPRIPSVAALLQVWSAFHGKPHEAGTSFAWGIAIHCTHNCTRIVEDYTVGIDTWAMTYTGAPGVAGEWTSDLRVSLLRVNKTGAPQAFRFLHDEAVQETLRPPGPAPGPNRPSPRVDVAPFTATAKDVAWSVPSTEQVMGAGIIGTLVGLVYWLWPQLKALLAALLYSRLARPAALDHPVRARLLDTITQNPGIHYQELARRVPIGHGALGHHLDKLRALRLVSVNTEGGYRCYFRAGAVDHRLMNAAAVLKSPQAKAMLRGVGARPGIGPSDLAAEVGVTPAGVTYHVRRFVQLGLVEARRQGPQSRLSLTQLGRAALAAPEDT